MMNKIRKIINSIESLRAPNCLYSLLVLFSFISFFSPQTFGASKIFIGPGHFSNPALWNGATLPASGDNLSIYSYCIIDNKEITDNIEYGTLVIGGIGVAVLSWDASGTNRLNVTNVSSSFPGSRLDMTNGGTLIIRGTWSSANLAFIPGSGTIEIRSAITLPSAYTTYNNLTINGVSITVSLGDNTTVNGALTFTNGTVTTGVHSIYVSSAGTVSRTSGHVNGNLKKNIATGTASKTFEIGDAGNYTPVTVDFAGVSIAGNLTARSDAGDHANIASATFYPLETANRNWTLSNSGIVFTNYSATFNFVAGDLDTAATTGNFIVGRFSAGWTYPTVGTKTSTSTQATALTAFGDFQLGEFGYSGPTGTGINSNIVSVNNNHLIIYPNPVIGTTIHVKIPNESGNETRVIIYNMNGQVMFLKKTIVASNGTLTITPDGVEKLVSGVYLFSLFSVNGSYHEKLIVL